MGVAPSNDHLPAQEDLQITYLDCKITAVLRACGHRRRATPTTSYEVLSISTPEQLELMSEIVLKA